MAFLWAVLVVGAVHSLDFYGSVPNFVKVTQGGTLLDVAPSFTPDAVYDRLAAYGSAGRDNYSFRNVTIDLLLPLSVVPFWVLFMRRALRSVESSRHWRIVLLSLPFVYLVFDVLENATVSTLLANYPARLDILASVLPYETATKRAASMLALFIPAGVLGFRFLRSRFEQSPSRS